LEIRHPLAGRGGRIRQLEITTSLATAVGMDAPGTARMEFIV
jgi:hypothetical protein